MFVRKKVTKAGTAKYYLVESSRDDGKVRQKVLYYLGDFPSPEAALADWEARIQRYHSCATQCRTEAAAGHVGLLCGDLNVVAEGWEAEAAHFEALRDELQSILEAHKP